MKTYVVYHANCPDGYGAALAAWMKFNDGAEYQPALYGKPPPEMAPESDIYIVDFSYPPNVLLDIARTAKHVVVLDHHASAEKDLAPDTWRHVFQIDECDLREVKDPADGFTAIMGDRLKIKFDMTKSGAVLAWEYFHPGKPLPMLLRYIQDRDLWKFDLPQSRQISAYLGTLPRDNTTKIFGAWVNCLNDFEREAERNSAAFGGDVALQLKQIEVGRMADQARWVLLDTELKHVVLEAEPDLSEGNGSRGIWEFPVANATVFFSEVGEELLNRNPDIQCAAYYFDRADGKRQWGLRSRPNFDCSEIGKAFGGGGHKQAAEFTTEIPSL